MGDVEGLGDKVGGVLFDGFQDDFHVVDDVVTGDDDGFVKVVIVVFGEEEADVFGFVGGETFAVDEDASVEAVGFAFEDESAGGFCVNFGMGFDGF